MPEAFRNFLALLGWSPGGDEEFLRTAELLEKFSLEGVSRTNGVFDRAKLEWFNTQYLQKLPIEDLLPFVEATAEARRFVERRVGERYAGHEWFSKTGGYACGRECGCCRIFQAGREHFLAMNS